MDYTIKSDLAGSQPGPFRRVKCKCCGKRFYIKDRYAYKRQYFKEKEVVFCSYKCMRMYDKNRIEADKERVVKGIAPNLDSPYWTTRFHFGMTKKKMQEWADYYNVDFTELWNLVAIQDFSILDAATILMQR